MMHRVPRLVKAMVQMIVDPEASPCSHMASILLGEYEIPEVSLPLLDHPALSLLLGLLEEMSGTLDLLMGLINITLLILMPGLTPPVSSLPSPSASAGLLIAPHHILSFITLTTTVKLPVLTLALPMPSL